MLYLTDNGRINLNFIILALQKPYRHGQKMSNLDYILCTMKIFLSTVAPPKKKTKFTVM